MIDQHLLNKQLKILHDNVVDYYRVSLSDGDTLNLLLQKINGTLYFIEEQKATLHDLYENKVYKLVEEGSSVARAVNIANKEYPEMYKLRKITDQAVRITESIRTHISYLKREQRASLQG